MNRKFLLLILGLLLVVFIIEYRMPRHFAWTPTFDHRDGQPFGCMVFDSLLAGSMPRGYSVTRQSLWQLRHDSAFMAEPHGIIILTDHEPDSVALRQICQMADSGHTVLLAVSDYVGWLEDSLGFSVMWNGYFSLQRYISNATANTLVYLPDSLCITPYEGLIERTMVVGKSVEFEPIITCLDGQVAWDDEDVYMVIEEDTDSIATDSIPEITSYTAIAFNVGRGQLIIVSTPLLMTNYGMLDDGIRLFIGRLMGRLKHLPVLRTEAYMKDTAQQEQSPFYVLLQRPPLRWALYLSVLTVLCLMFFTARRRQRAIPFVEEPRNANLELVRLVGTLSWQQGDHRGLVERKLQYAAEEVRRLVGIDLLAADKDDLQQLARLTGLTYDELRLRLANAREATTGHHVVTTEEMRVHIDNLNEIINLLS